MGNGRGRRGGRGGRGDRGRGRKRSGNGKGNGKGNEKDVEVVIDAVMVHGNTFPLRSDLKEHGFRWDPTEREWWREARGFGESSVCWLRSFSMVEVEFGAKVVRERRRAPSPKPKPKPPSLRWGEAVEEMSRRLGPDEIEALKRLLRHGDASFQLYTRPASDFEAVVVRFGPYVITRYKTGNVQLSGKGLPNGSVATTLIEGVARIVRGAGGRQLPKLSCVR